MIHEHIVALEALVVALQERVQEEISHTNRVMREKGRLKVINSALADKITEVTADIARVRTDNEAYSARNSELRERLSVAEAKLVGTYVPGRPKADPPKFTGPPSMGI